MKRLIKFWNSEIPFRISANIFLALGAAFMTGAFFMEGADRKIILVLSGLCCIVFGLMHWSNRNED